MTCRPGMMLFLIAHCSCEFLDEPAANMADESLSAVQRAAELANKPLAPNEGDGSMHSGEQPAQEMATLGPKQLEASAELLDELQVSAKSEVSAGDDMDIAANGPYYGPYRPWCHAMQTSSDGSCGWDFMPAGRCRSAKLPYCNIAAKKCGITRDHKSDEFDFEPAACAAGCASHCKNREFCCNDYTIGSNQMISCAQACIMRTRGLPREDCRRHCDRGPSSGCSKVVQGNKYSFCSSCTDLTNNPKCRHGVASPDDAIGVANIILIFFLDHKPFNPCPCAEEHDGIQGKLLLAEL
eukprot:CAMPEP_0172834484 /NCGR_PEP_ID=MMETSP1075-20121228/25082_1 /TAXON_ID=2916 /ORGANISM="Ceratium fusus, Strain PA161109" /LENGTH=295 /DNA_ID=CAMNT_0013677393 /DNA_START=35 /DNA_END=920 /DNA_ORIENTATION=-